MEKKEFNEPKMCFRCHRTVKAGKTMHPIKRGRYIAYIGDCCKYKKKRR